MSIIQICDITNHQSMLQDLTAQETVGIVGGMKGGMKGGGGAPAPAPAPVESGNANPFIFDEIGPGNSRRDRFVVSPNGDVFQYNRKGSAKSSFAFNPNFASGGKFGG